MQEVRTCREAANRLGFALNLLLLHFLHCPLPDVTLTPSRIVQFVAVQLNVHPDVLAEYSVRRPQTRGEHLVQIRGCLKLSPYAHEGDDPHLIAMSDGIRFEVCACSLHAQYHARYFGPCRGVTLHDMISNQCL